MKKFSWIFALILALSMAFVFTGCPGPDEDTPPPDSGAKVPSNPANKVVTFGTGAGQTQVYEKDPPTGTIAYAGGGYSYTYGGGSASTYGGALVRFMVDLGDKTLADYGSVTFKWKADGYKDDDSVASNKKLYLLAAIDETEIMYPGKTDAGYLTDDEIKDVIVSSNYFDPRPDTGNNFWSEPGYPNVNGNNELTVTLPIVRRKYLGGEVWFSIYVHAVKDKYTISDFKLVEGAYTGGPTVAGDTANAPDRPPPETGNESVNFDVDLTANTDTTPESANINSTLPEITGDGPITVTFTENSQRINFKFTEEQVALLTGRDSNTIRITIVGEVTSGTGDSFRYHIGNAMSGSNWNATSGSGDGKLANILITEQTFTANATSEGTLDYFILQHRSADSVTITITSINIRTVTLPEAPAFFTAATALTAGIGIYGTGSHFIQGGVITVKGNGGFSVDLPEGFTVSDTVVVEYACYLTELTNAKFIKKQGSGWTDVNDPSKYPSFATDAVSTITVTGFNADGVTAGKVFFQTNTDEGQFEARIKIISVTIKDDED